MKTKNRAELRHIWRQRSPVIRERAHRYLLIYLIAFAGSVILTRLFLEITGYPQIGKGTFHLAHVLWGGLLLFIASLIPLMYANRWALSLTTLISGLGIGLFMDEVGKFITRNNDYFFPAAAPIIYALFLLTVWIFTRIRRTPKWDARQEMYAVLEDLKEVPDSDLEPDEREILLARLRRIEQGSGSDLTELSLAMRRALEADHFPVQPARRDRIEILRNRMESWASAHFTYPFHRRILLLGMILIGVLALGELANLLLLMRNYQFSLSAFFHSNLDVVGFNVAVNAAWYLIHVVLQTLLAILSFSSFGLIVFKDTRRGINLGIAVAIASLTIVDLLAFYVNQFSAAVDALVQFLVLLGLLYFRSRFLTNEPHQIA